MKMTKNKIAYQYLGFAFLALSFSACVAPANIVTKKANTKVPESFKNSQDSTNTAKSKWKDYFTDPFLSALIDTALQNNQELNITLQEIEISKNEISARKGEYLPFVNIGGGTGVEKVSRYTSQ